MQAISAEYSYVYSGEKYDGMQPSEFVTFFAVSRKQMRGHILCLQRKIWRDYVFSLGSIHSWLLLSCYH